MFSTINETKTPSELVEWLRLWANGYEDGDALDDNDARQIADAVERVYAPCNAAALREALNRVCYLSPTEAQDLRQLAKLCYDQDIYGGGLIERTLDDIEIARAALAAPPRNCDLYKDCNAAWKAYNAITDRERLPGFDFWLFEEAKQEGGAPQARHGYGTPDMAGMGVVNGG